MTRKRRRLVVVLIVVSVAAGVLVAGNAQYLLFSTYRVKNDSGPPVAMVRLTLDTTRGSRPVAVLDVARDHSRTGWLRFVGEASLSAEVTDNDGKARSCSTYLEGALYHVDVNVDAMGHPDCWVRVVDPLEVGWFNVIP